MESQELKQHTKKSFKKVEKEVDKQRKAEQDFLDAKREHERGSSERGEY